MKAVQGQVKDGGVSWPQAAKRREFAGAGDSPVLMLPGKPAAVPVDVSKSLTANGADASATKVLHLTSSNHCRSRLQVISISCTEWYGQGAVDGDAWKPCRLLPDAHASHEVGSFHKHEVHFGHVAARRCCCTRCSAGWRRQRRAWQRRCRRRTPTCPPARPGPSRCAQF